MASSLIVVRIIPTQPLHPDDFTTYLNPGGTLGSLQITAYELSFSDPDVGKKLGTATYVALPAAPDPTSPQPLPYSLTSPVYSPSSPKTGIVQQYDVAPSALFESAYFQLDAVATAIIEIPAAAAIENLRLEVEWVSGSNTTAVPVPQLFYDVRLDASPAPDLNAWSPSSTETTFQPDPWGQLEPSVYLHLPSPPSTSNPFSFAVPTDGSAPPFDGLLAAVKTILSKDPGSALVVATSSPTAAGDSTLHFPASTTGIAVGMGVSGTAVPAAATVVQVKPGVDVTLSEEASAAVSGSITFTPNLGTLSIDQCRNIASEIVWMQQPPPPDPPDSLGELYSDPPNTGPMLTGTTPNQAEGERQQFEGNLTAYYTLADAAASRLTNFVYALSAAVACEQRTLSATQALLELPANAAAAGGGPVSGAEIILTAIDTVLPPTNFGVPAAYFYALGAVFPVQVDANQRFQLASGDHLDRLLAELTSAIDSGVVTDGEAFVADPTTIDAAQAARRIVALGIPTAATTPLAPLGARMLQTVGDAASGTTLTVASTAGLTAGMRVTGTNVPLAATVASLTDTTITLSAPLLGDVSAGASIFVVPAYSAAMVALVKGWLDYPAAITGVPSSQSYLSTDDDEKLWPALEAAQPDAYLDLVLSALTEGFIVPPPENEALGDLIEDKLLTAKTVDALAAVTRAQWVQFFTDHPTWLPPGTGNLSARIDAFIRQVQAFFVVIAGGPMAPFVLATTAATASGSNTLEFAPTKLISVGMLVSGPGIPAGTTVTKVSPPPGPTKVTLSVAVTAALPIGSVITFSMSVSPGKSPGLPVFAAPTEDWLSEILAAYGAYTLGAGFDLAKLQGAAATVFGDDADAQDWAVDALVALDALYQVMTSVTLPPPATPALAFSIVEALYARGFTSAQTITALTGDQFQQALVGTIAYDLANKIYTSASAIAPPTPATPGSGGFKAVNPDGSLTNCVPEPCASPLGPIAYLSELLNLSALSTCDTPVASAVSLSTSADTPSGATLPFVSTAGLSAAMTVSGTNIEDGTALMSVGATSVTLNQGVSADVAKGSVITFAAPTLESLIAKRRGAIGDLTASCANLETPLPLIDIVNECLESMGSVPVPTGGVVYDTSDDALAGHLLCHDEPCPPDECAPFCHDPARVFAALPEYSTPATPVAANSAVEPAVFNKLKVDFSSCNLPYSQALDVSRTYLRHFGSCRVEEMRTFRRCITEFVLDPANEPTGFQDHLWRFPVRIDTAVEYLGITPEEYSLLFHGTPAPLCGPGAQRQPPNQPTPNQPNPNQPNPNQPNPNQPNPPGANPNANPARFNADAPPAPAVPSDGPAVWELYGFTSQGDNENWVDVVTQLPEFLARTCLSYCDFYELWKSGFVQFSNQSQQDGTFPECEPCCLDRLTLAFPDQQRGDDGALLQLVVFIRLWRKLKDSCCFCYSFAQLRDICDVLQLFDAGGTINPEFIRQLAAFQMLRDQFCLDLVDPSEKPAPTAVDADRTQLLALWVGPTAAKWGWAVRQLCEKVVQCARVRYECDRHPPELVEWLMSKLDALSALAGFDPASATDNWHALPTHTLRFAEILGKLVGSKFTLAEVLYLFTAEDEHWRDIFPMQDDFEALEHPLGLPAEDCEFSLRHLRRRLLRATLPELGEDSEWRISFEVDRKERDERGEHEEEREEIRVEETITEEGDDDWDWNRVSRFLTEDLGFALNDVLDLGRHLFPHLLQKSGFVVDVTATRFATALAAVNTTPAMWSAVSDGPLQYDPAGTLWTHIPLADESLVGQLARLNALNADEQEAVQDLYFQPRAMLALFAALFPTFVEAARHLIQVRDEGERWEYFRRHVAQCHHRCRMIARHLAEHVEAVTRQPCPDGEAVAMRILRDLLGDENKATSDWERDDGSEPAVTWTPPPNGGAFAALLGLVGTGLVTEYQVDGGGAVWREVTGSLDGFGAYHDRENMPVPTVLPSLGATITPAQAKFASVNNGLLVKNAGGALLGGAQGFDVTWSGALLVDEEGPYEFWAGAPTPRREKPDCDAVDRFKWRVTLKRGSKTWVLLSHRWPGEEERRSSSRHLRRGAYDITVELVRPPFDFATEDQVHKLHAGLEVKYAGPDSFGERIAIPRRSLFSVLKDDTLGNESPSIAPQSASAALFLQRYYTSSFRDMRRTYQRAFKAVLFAHRFALAAKRDCQGTSEIGYMLEEKERFAGFSFYRRGSSFLRHAANFDFNYLPLFDDYHPPTGDSRTSPSPKRIQAMFDWWERTFDYTVARKDVRRRRDRQLWHLFAEARATHPTDPAPLLVYLGADPRFWQLELRYFQNQSAPPYGVSSDDLQDDRWTIRAWHADRWLDALNEHFASQDITVARPDLWASDDPSALLPTETETGNANLSAFLCDGCLEHGKPPRYDELRHLNDGLRCRGRDALVAYLCHEDRVALPWSPGQYATQPRDLSELLLLDVEAGVCEKASRIEEAIAAVQDFVDRARLLLEPTFTVTPSFLRLWDDEFATFRIWQACKRRKLYKENYVDWSDLKKARHIESFRFLEDKLRSVELTAPVPGSSTWWPDVRPPASEPTPLERREPSSIQMLAAEREGINLLGTPERDARPSWIAAIQEEVTRDPALSSGGAQPLPLWIQAAIRMGTQFLRIAAAGSPPASSQFRPHTRDGTDDCVSCCEECGCSHPDLVDEYYFWLIPSETYEPPTAPTLSGGSGSGSNTDYQNGFQDDYYDAVQQQSAVWDDPAHLPQLLEWPSTPAVRLAWCRVHNGEFQQPRRSIFALEVDSSKAGDLQFLGRNADSLTFSVPNGLAPEGYADPSQPGFRYDMAEDSAVVLPEVLAPPAPTTFLSPTNLPAYPWFLFEDPGASLLPVSPFSPALAVAQVLRAHCRFEPALAWYRSAFNPLSQDCTWVDCGSDDGGQGGGANNRDLAIRQRLPFAACCDSTDISCDEARDRSVVLHYLETLIEWGDAVRRHGRSWESTQQARTIFESAAKILGPIPRTVKLPEPASPPKVSGFVPQLPSLNPRLLDIYEIVRDRLDNIRACANDRRLRDGARLVETDTFGDDPLREGWRNSVTACDDDAEWCFLRSPYRFAFLIQKANEYASRTQELGNALLAAFEKGDAEYLASLRAGQERELLTLGLESRKDAWRDADWQIESLQKTKAMNQVNLEYYTALKTNGLIAGETAYQTMTVASTFLRGTGNLIEAIAGAMSAAGNYFMGVAGFGGTPLIYSQLPVGEPLAGDFAANARILVALADIANTTAGLELTESGWDRRLAEWTHQIDLLNIEIQQAERQILGAQRRRDQMLNDLNTQQRQIDHAAEVQDFLRDKFTAHDLYLYLQKETAALHSRTYELALRAGRQAQHAFNVERGFTARRFVPECAWDSLHEGLLAGDRLSASLRQMEKAYLDENVREYELTKQISLRLHFPAEFLQLRTTGRCEIEIPEWMFDLDFPGHYMRRIKSVSVTIPCVTGPYTGVHCRLTLLGSTTRIDPRLTTPAHECCCPRECCDGCDVCERMGREYAACPDDPRTVRQFGAREAVATSTGQNDAGLFTLDFNDQRYLPFEYAGAVSRWRIELPPENNYFDMNSLTDFVMRIPYTSREGGPRLREAAECAARGRLPGDGWRLIDVRHELPDAWQRFGDSQHHGENESRIDVRLERRMFPFVPGGREIVIGGMAILVGRHPHEHRCRECDCAEPFGCPCREHREAARTIVEFRQGEDECVESTRVECLANEAWPDFYFGTVKSRIGPIGERRRHADVQLRFHRSARHMDQLFLLCRYASISACGCGDRRDPWSRGELAREFQLR